MRVLKGPLNYLSRSCRRNCCPVTLEATCAEGLRTNEGTRHTAAGIGGGTQIPPPPLRHPASNLRRATRERGQRLSRGAGAAGGGGVGKVLLKGGRRKKLYLCERARIDRRAMRVSTKFRANKSVSQAGEKKKKKNLSENTNRSFFSEVRNEQRSRGRGCSQG